MSNENPPIIRRLDPLHGRIQPDTLRRQPRLDRLHQSLHPLARRQELPIPCAAPSRVADPGGLTPAARLMRPHPPNQTSPPPLHLDELRQRGLHAQLRRIGRVDATDQRLNQSLEGLAAKSPDYERFETLVGSVALRGREMLPSHPQLSKWAKQRRRDNRPDFGR